MLVSRMRRRALRGSSGDLSLCVVTNQIRFALLKGFLGCCDSPGFEGRPVLRRRELPGVFELQLSSSRVLSRSERPRLPFIIINLS